MSARRNEWIRGALSLALAVLLVAGCAAPGTYGDPTERGRDVPATQQPDKAAEPELSAPPAVVALLEQAEEASAAGEHDRAAALLERALRIDPRNAVLWHNLAVVRYRQGEYAQADSMAQRSLQHLSGRSDLQKRNWQLIAVSRELAGDTAGAAQARARLSTFGAASGQ
ncbi:MAG: tetratricopeptide repeat protein [Ectothiorhodospiraceae bacterium]|nr:tetratricopeptide repeat protein [Ectothiorhodospiraceae bacterium]